MNRVIFFLAFVISSAAHGLDLDKEPISVAHIILPTEPIEDPSLRTFSIDVGTSFWPDVIYESLEQNFELHGFEQNDQYPGLQINIFFDGIFFNKTDVSVRIEETKDSEGKVRKKYYYKPFIIYSATSNVDVIYPNGMVKNYKFGSKNNEHTGPESSTRYSAQNYFDGNIDQLRDQLYRQFVNKTINEVKNKLNSKHGYQPTQQKTHLLILDSKRYDEYKDYKKYYELIKRSFTKMTPFDSVENIKTEVQPAIDFLVAIPAKYPKKKRAHKKMRYASFYNLGVIYMYLDEYDKAAEFFQKVVENDYREGSSERKLKQIDGIKNRMIINKVSGRHFNITAQ